MLRDFLTFLRHLFELLHFVRGALGGLLLILALCALVMVVAEGLTLGEALYLTAITGLTVGYCDLAPATALGRIASVVAGFVGRPRGLSGTAPAVDENADGLAGGVSRRPRC